VTATSSVRKGTPWELLRRPGFLFTLGAVAGLDALTGLIVFGYGNTYLLNVLDAPESFPAYSVAIYGLVKLIVAPAGGWLLERNGGRTTALAAAVATASGLTLVLASKSAEAYLGAIGLISLGQALAWLHVFHAIGHHHGTEERGGATAWMGLISAGATAAGLGLAAVLAETVHWRIPFGLAIALSMVTLFAMLAMPRAPSQVKEERPPPEPAGGQAASTVRGRRFAATLIIFGHFATTSALVAGIAPLALRTLDLSLLQALVALAPAGVGAAVGMFLIGPRSRPGRRLQLAAMLYALAAVAIGLAAGAPGPVMLAVAALPLGISFGGAQPVVNASLIDAARSEERSGVALGYLFFVEGLGSIAGPAVVGIAIELADVRTGVAAIAVMALCVSLAAARSSRTIAL
jgi:predicted MFS family arabinose efflux permease